MKTIKSKDGFGYDLDNALKKGNIFERIFHRFRISPWIRGINYSGKKVLDIGCNTGILLLPLLELGVDIVGIDISSQDIKRTREKLVEKGFSVNRAKVGDAKKLPFKDDAFDIILLSDILEHVDRPELVAKEAFRVTRHGGNIFATVPNSWHPVVRFSWLRKVLSGRKNFEEHPDVPYDFQKLVKLFPDAQVVEKKLAGFWVQIFCQFRKP